MDSIKDKINILFVGSGPEGYYIPILFDEISYIKSKCPELIEYAKENKLFRKDCANQMPWINTKEIPLKYLEVFKPEKTTTRDFDIYRHIIIHKIKELYPNIKEITYTFIDNSQREYPGMFDTPDILLNNDLQVYETYGIKFIFNNYHIGKFQQYIKESKHIYDIVCFLGCGPACLIIENNNEYMNNFKNILHPSGFIIHMMYNSNQESRLDFLDFEETYKNILGYGDDQMKNILGYTDEKLKFKYGFGIERLKELMNDNTEKYLIVKSFSDKLIRTERGIYKFP